jgi:hypothetical protein
LGEKVPGKLKLIYVFLIRKSGDTEQVVVHNTYKLPEQLDFDNFLEQLGQCQWQQAGF